jgi:hypothetical protein
MDIYKCDTCGKEITSIDSNKDYEKFMTIKYWKNKGEKYPCFSLDCKGYFELVKGDNNMSTAIKIEDSIQEIIKKMSEMSSGGYNPGATTVLINIIEQGNFIDHDSWAGGLNAILLMDSWDIRGEKIWMLYKDVCKQDLVKMLAVLKACQLGFTNIGQLNTAIMNRGQGLDVDECLTKVQEKLPNFNRDIEPEE